MYSRTEPFMWFDCGERNIIGRFDLPYYFRILQGKQRELWKKMINCCLTDRQYIF